MVSNIEIKNFEKLFLETFNDKLNVKISTWRKITYNSNGQVKCFANYNSNFQIFDFSSKVQEIHSNWFMRLKRDEKHFITKEKSNDLRTKLIPYIKSDNQKFYEDYLLKYSLDNN